MADQLPAEPSADDFQRWWVRPAHALLTFGVLGDGYACSEMYRRLSRGMLYAAGSAPSLNALARRSPRLIIPPNWWQNTPGVQQRASTLWVTSGAKLASFRDAGRGAVTEHDVFGIRFDPYGLQQMADDAGIGAVIAPNMVLAKALEEYLPTLPAAPSTQIATAVDGVSHDEIKAWFERLRAADQLLSGKKLWRLSQPAFHPRRVYRKQFDWITETRDPGPRKTR